MKTFRSLGLAVVALIMSLNFVSCNTDTITPDEQKYIEVDLACTGELLDITHSPLSKTGINNSDSYFIEVFSLIQKPGTGAGEVYYEPTRYAYGMFRHSLDGVTIRLIEGQLYRFRVSITLDDYPDSGGIETREFNYSSNAYAKGISLEKEGFYGELDMYTPSEGASVRIETKRVSYGVKMIAEQLTEGTLNVGVQQYQSGTSLYYITLTPETYEHEKIYSFYDTWQAWKGSKVHDNATGTESYVNYSTTKYLNINWTKANGSVIPLGVFPVTFERNVMTTIRITAEDTGANNGITVVRETAALQPGDKEFQISGGSVTEVILNNGNGTK